MTDKRFAKDVARELDRRKRNRRMLILGTWGALIVLAVLYLRCGGGWGLGGKGGGDGTGSGNGSGTVAAADAGRHRCAIRVSAAGISVDGKPMKRDQAVTICSKTGAADVVVTGDAREGDWKALEAELKAAKVDIALHDRTP